NDGARWPGMLRYPPGLAVAGLAEAQAGLAAWVALAPPAWLAAAACRRPALAARLRQARRPCRLPVRSDRWRIPPAASRRSSAPHLPVLDGRSADALAAPSAYSPSRSAATGWRRTRGRRATS